MPVALPDAATLPDAASRHDHAGVLVRGLGLLPMAPGAFRSRRDRRRRPRDRALGAAGSPASQGAHGVSIWAMTLAPIAGVAALRGTSIPFAAPILAGVAPTRP